jgi:hypothetical protein
MRIFAQIAEIRHGPTEDFDYSETDDNARIWKSSMS